MTVRHLSHFLSEQAERFGDRTALLGRAEGPTPGPRLSWREFEAGSRAVGRALAACGVGEGDAVALFSGNRPEWLLADFGCHFARAVPVPVYPTSATSQADFILRETEARILFVGATEQYDKAREIAAGGGAFRIVLLDPALETRGESGTLTFGAFLALGEEPRWDEELRRRGERACREDLFTILYTSGTTGQQKGVMLTHANVLDVFAPHDARLRPTMPGDVSLCFLPLSHVFERGWTYYALYRGMEVHCVENPTKVMEALARSRPVVMCSVPRLMEKIQAAILQRRDASPPWKRRLFDWAVRVGGEAGEYRREGRPVPLGLALRRQVAHRVVLKRIRALFGGRLRFMPCAGAPFAADLDAFFWGAGVNTVHGYGLSETTATVCANAISGFRFGSVGPPLMGTELRIAEDGEILVRGPGVMKGYYKREAETAEVLKDGWFHTGDMGELDAQGRLTITDRLKDLIKTSSGKAVAPQFLEAGVARDPMVDQVAVVGDLRHYITALIVPAREALAEYARNHGISYQSFEELVRKPEIVALYDEKIAAFNRSLARFEQIRKFTLLPRPFTVEGGEITPTLKVRRQRIIEKYREVLDAMYADTEPTPAT